MRQRPLPIPFETKDAAGAELAPDVEVKFLESWGDKFEIKLAANETEGGVGIIEGYASVFGEEDRINDIVLPGAFRKSLSARRGLGRIPMLVGHAQRIPVGVWTEMVEDGKGLKVRGQIDIQSPDGGQLYRVAKMGAELGISIGYRATVYEYRVNPSTNDQVRLLKEVDLYECSLVTIPCCDGARVTQVKQMPAEPPEQIAERAAIQLLNKSAEDFHAACAMERAAALFRV